MQIGAPDGDASDSMEDEEEMREESTADRRNLVRTRTQLTSDGGRSMEDKGDDDGVPSLASQVLKRFQGPPEDLPDSSEALSRNVRLGTDWRVPWPAAHDCQWSGDHFGSSERLCSVAIRTAADDVGWGYVPLLGTWVRENGSECDS